MGRLNDILKELDSKGNLYLVLENGQNINITYVGQKTYLVESEVKGNLTSTYRPRYNLVNMLKELDIKHYE